MKATSWFQSQSHCRFNERNSFTGRRGSGFISRALLECLLEPFVVPSPHFICKSRSSLYARGWGEREFFSPIHRSNGLFTLFESSGKQWRRLASISPLPIDRGTLHQGKLLGRVQRRLVLILSSTQLTKMKEFSSRGKRTAGTHSRCISLS